MLTTQEGVLSFRHELARLTVEEAVPLARRVELHRAALAELEARPAEEHDLARLAHHADAAATPLRCSSSLLAPLNKRPQSARTERLPASTGEHFATRMGSLLRNARRFCRGTRASAI